MALRDLFGRRQAASGQTDGVQQTQSANSQAAEEQSLNSQSSVPAADVSYSMSPGFAPRLAKLDVAPAITSYQSGLLYLLGRNPRTGGLNVHQTAIRRPMGIAHAPDGSLILAAGFHLIRFINTLDSDQRANEIFDCCYVPRTVHMTGDLDAHDVGVDAQGTPIFVNTRFNCLAALSERHSFEEVWRPSFISALVDEDRCHLNGLAMRNGKPAYVTAVSRSDTIDGWRDRRADGGVVIDVESGAIVCDGLSMPHSPRMHQGALWVLNSGTGELGRIEMAGNGAKGRFVPVAFCPGFLRGLAISGNYAFVGLSKPRYKRFEGLALDERLQAADSEPWCGIQVIDLESRSCVDWFRIDGPVAELYDLTLIPGFACPMAVSPGSVEATGVVTYPRQAPASPESSHSSIRPATEETMS